MQRDELTRKLARQAGISRAAAADRIDAIVNDILARLRRGRTAELPGLGRLVPDRDGCRFQPEEEDKP